MAHKDLKSLKEAINEKAKESLKKRVYPVIQRKIIGNIRTEVYDVYTPVEYGRTWQFMNPNNVSSYTYGGFNNNIFDNELSLSVTHNDDRDGLTQLIILGQDWANMYDNVLLYDDIAIKRTKSRWERKGRTDKKGFWEARDFMQATRDDIKGDSMIVDIFKKGMK